RGRRRDAGAGGHGGRMSARELFKAAGARFSVRRVAELLAEEGIEVMPLKGALLLETVYAGKLRVISDVDLLVRPRDYARAARRLGQAGFSELARDRDDRSRTLKGPLPCVVDLHRWLFQRHLFRLRTDALFARGRPDEALFGTRIVLPDPRDLYAHLLGHFAKSRFGRGHGAKLAELDAVQAHHALSAPVLAAHLRATGMLRVATYVLGRSGSASARALLDALEPGLVDRSVVESVRPLLERRRAGALSVVGVHGLNESLPRASLSLASHLLGGARRRVLPV
ncbi:MAG TPA: nucleotidyltransferase family protein, partial [Polyangiaceae bacterium LLY-WYZ-15_(1-7)]|nr:nucleotidyltransferase family protein [Polyangiaceae bacterium LLY-WYZ-15_(1-7)]